MLKFLVVGPKAIPTECKNTIDGKTLPRALQTLFGEYANRYGCYVFSVNRNGRSPDDLDGLMPIYVGKTSRSFVKECSTSGTVGKLNRYLIRHPTKKLSLFLVVHPPQQGQMNKKAMGELEKFLIQQAASRNPKILNIQNIKPEQWGIKGVLRGGQGKRSTAANRFRVTMDLNGSGG